MSRQVGKPGTAGGRNRLETLSIVETERLWHDRTTGGGAALRGSAMAEREPADTRRYKAFISYSHKDAQHGRWLHRRLESYRLPRRLIGLKTERGIVPARLAPIFRDREELPAAGDLSDKVRAALAVSETLIVVCSPNAAASPWVAREISLFRELHPDRPILAALIEGEPSEAFPEAMRMSHEGGAIEPLAADLRRESDGKRLGLLKLVAGLTGVGLDTLVQRDAQRRIRRVTAVTLAALAAAVVMGLLTLVAIESRAEAERQRHEAEGLIEFMLTDLRTRLKGVGRLDVLTAVNERAMTYYGDQQRLEDLPADSLERRARILHAMGEDDSLRGDPAAALQKFKEAQRTTAALLAKAPEDPQRIYAHSQSEFWIGSIDYGRGDFAKAKAAWERYKALADRLVAIDPTNAEWLKEGGYAEGNLCTIALAKPVDAKAALKSCAASLAYMERAARVSSAGALTSDLANRHAWLADAYVAAGDRNRALFHRHAQEKLLSALTAGDPQNMDVKDMWLTLQFALASLERDAGDYARARARLVQALVLAQSMIRRDPENAQWIGRRERITRDLTRLIELENEKGKR